MRDWKKITVWELSHQFFLETYKVTATFPKEEVYNLTSQLRRSSLSIPTNIVEGAGRESDAEFVRFLVIAQSSSNEVQYLLFAAKDLNYINNEKYVDLDDKVDKIKRMLFNLCKKIRNN
jgi:four helix bundle protein